MTPAGQVTPEVPISSPEPADKKRAAALSLLEQVTDQTIRQQIISAEVARELFDQDWRLARVFQASGQFKDLKKLTQDQAIATAMAKIRLGRGWGLNETEAMQFVVFINGVPTIQNEIIASRLMDAGYYWDLIWEEKAEKDGGMLTTGCIFLPKYRKSPTADYQPMLDGRGQPLRLHFGLYEASHTIIYEDNKQIKLSEKWNYVAYPKSMYFWRCIAMFRRQHVTNVMSGARMPLEAEEISLDAVAEETERRQEAGKAAEEWAAEMEKRGATIHQVSTGKPQADVVISKLIGLGKIEEAKEEARKRGVDWAPFQEHLDASGHAPAPPAPAPPPMTERDLAHVKDLRKYLERIGPEKFGAILVKHEFGSLDDAARASDAKFMAMVPDLEEALPPAQPSKMDPGKFSLA